jgi:hypothetical protein
MHTRWWFAGAAFVFTALTAVALSVYGGGSYWPTLATEFGASLAAFWLAFRLESDRGLRQARERVARAEAEEMQRRETEARRRLLTLQAELKRNQVSIDMLADKVPAIAMGAVHDLLHPELLDGAWVASGARLGDLLANYDLAADLATFYGRLEELRWRIRHRTAVRDSYLDPMTRQLAVEMKDEVAELLDRVTEEAKNPEAQPIGLVHVDAGMVMAVGKPGI